MKKSLFVFVAILIASSILIAGCTEKAPTTAPATAPTTAPATTPPAEKPIELKLSSHNPPQSFLVKGVITPWAQSVEAASNGRVKIAVYTGETLVKMQDEYDSLYNGLSDIAVVAPGVTPNRFPLSEIDTLPMLFSSAEMAGKIHTELLNEYCADSELSDVKFLFDVSLPPMQFFLNKPVEKLEDMNGLKMRIEGKVEGWTMEALGATGILISTGEMSTSLERGLIDGCALVWEGGLAFGIPQVTQYRTQVDIYTRCFPMLMNQDAWNGLPPDIQNLFSQMSGPAVSAQYGAAADGAMAGAKQAIIGMDKGAGKADIVVLSDTEKARWREALLPVWDKWVEERSNVPARKMLDDAVAQIEQFSK